ncbi:FMN-binding protein [Mariniflexile sp. AS56]|uniref:FMN-binding protein n=1 Tax=Mariniflexile sp. AS56 TaxID=3063957 RepID=UPI0026EC3F51|nr:FMN-binding protein [Mariniflexile sp. AS56]MDO7173814.1 FMN-binding protein [Mariniflexile sp. AS56]
MIFKKVTILLLAFSLLSFSIQKDLSKKIDKEIKDTFKLSSYAYTPISFSTEINKELPSQFDAKNFISIHANKKVVGYAYMGKAPSKTDEFDYLVLLDTDHIVLKTKVTAYREDYGGEIGSKRWLQQFIGKKASDNLRYGDNIVAISGATISVRSMTNAMNNLLKSLKMLQSKKLL